MGKQLVNHAVHYATSQGNKTSEVSTGNASSVSNRRVSNHRGR
ncbi:hypothetical protein [Ectobacillus funiculus]|nr:hypothetical protein [Ectobacillus funiculus]